MTETRGSVFVSHASEDAAAAQRVCELLRAAGIEVWLDDSELRGGDAWDAMIRARIRGCTLFVALISAHTRARSEGYFRLEWKLAIDRSYHIASDRPFLLPLAIDDTRQAEARVPDRFREVQWTSAPRGELPREFLQRLGRMLETATGPLGAAAAEPDAWLEGVAEKSLAVMPFANLSADKESEFFSDGLAEEILNALSGIAELRVAARTSSFYFKGRATDLQEIAQRLRVAHIVEGSVRRSADRVRVTAKLVDVSNGFQLWSERYDRELKDVFEIQDDIARAICARLKVALLTAARRPTANMEAYELYLHGRHELNQRSRTSVHTAIRYFERCIALDPDYALAHAGLVDCYGLLPYRGSMSHAEAKARAQIAVSKAMQHAPELWECNYARALYSLYFEGNWSEAGVYLERALGINPRAPMVTVHRALLHSVLHHETETARWTDAACQLDPLAPVVHALGSWALALVGNFPESERQARLALELQPDYVPGLLRRAVALTGLEHHAEAVATMERGAALLEFPFATGMLGLMYARAGRSEDAARLRQELEDRASRDELSVRLALLILELGSRDTARVRAALTAALADGTGAYHIKIASDPFLQTYRSDPEIDRLHRRLYGW